MVPVTEPREVVFADVLLRRPRCTPDTDAILDVPVESARLSGLSCPPRPGWSRSAPDLAWGGRAPRGCGAPGGAVAEKGQRPLAFEMQLGPRLLSWGVATQSVHFVLIQPR